MKTLKLREFHNFAQIYTASICEAKILNLPNKSSNHCTGVFSELVAWINPFTELNC